jgi:hypothetical protein
MDRRAPNTTKGNSLISSLPKNVSILGPVNQDKLCRIFFLDFRTTKKAMAADSTKAAELGSGTPTAIEESHVVQQRGNGLISVTVSPSALLKVRVARDVSERRRSSIG